MDPVYPVQGIITVLNTPFTSSGALDPPPLRHHVQYAMDAGVDGFLVPAMASEVGKLTLEERIKVVEVVLDAADSEVPVFAGTGETDLHRSKKLLSSYLEIGCSHVLFQIPYQDRTQFRNHFRELASLQPEVIMLQDWDASGYGYPEDLIVNLFEEEEAFKCLKVETSPAGVKYSRILELTDGELHVSGGWAVTQMIEGLKRGVHAFMPTGMHYIYTEIYNDYINGRKYRSRKLFEDILPILSFSNQHLDISIHFFKRLLHAQNIYNTPNVRGVEIEFDSIHEEISNELIKRVIRIENKIRKSR